MLLQLCERPAILRMHDSFRAPLPRALLVILSYVLSVDKASVLVHTGEEKLRVVYRGSLCLPSRANMGKETITTGVASA